MLANSLAPCITTPKVEEPRDFYVKYVGAKIAFDGINGNGRPFSEDQGATWF